MGCGAGTETAGSKPFDTRNTSAVGATGMRIDGLTIAISGSAAAAAKPEAHARCRAAAELLRNAIAATHATANTTALFHADSRKKETQADSFHVSHQ